MTLTEIMSKAAAGGYGDESRLIGKIAGLVQSGIFDRVDAPFICGTTGSRGVDGLHDGYLICPTYGEDYRDPALFKRVAR